MEVTPEIREKNNQGALNFAQVLKEAAKAHATPDDALKCLEILLDQNDRVAMLRVARTRIRECLLLKAVFNSPYKIGGVKREEEEEKDALPADFDDRADLASERLAKLAQEKRVSLVLTDLMAEIFLKHEGESMRAVRAELESLFLGINDYDRVDTPEGYDSVSGVLDSFALELDEARRRTDELAEHAIDYAIRHGDKNNSTVFDEDDLYKFSMYSPQFTPMPMHPVVRDFIERRYMEIPSSAEKYVKSHKVIYLRFRGETRAPRWMALHLDPNRNTIQGYHYVNILDPVPHRGNQDLDIPESEESDDRNAATSLFTHDFADDRPSLLPAVAGDKSNQPKGQVGSKPGLWGRIKRGLGF